MCIDFAQLRIDRTGVDDHNVIVFQAAQRSDVFLRQQARMAISQNSESRTHLWSD